MGGQACVFYGGAEFSRDVDLLVGSDAESIDLVGKAFELLYAELTSVLDLECIGRGHAVHYRCHRPDVEGLRIDLMARVRGLDSFGQLWSRRTTLVVQDTEVDLLSLPDLIKAKKTQRSQDWPMIQRLVERVYFTLPARPERQLIDFLLAELRTPELLVELTKSYPAASDEAALQRPAVERALKGTFLDVTLALAAEEMAERNRDAEYWRPLRSELEQLRKPRSTVR